MFPRAARLHCAPFEDFTLRAEILDKATFWCSRESKDFYGIDVSVLGPEATKTYFVQPVVDAFDPEMLLADPATFEFDFLGDETNENGETNGETNAKRTNAEHLERLFLRADFVSNRDGVAHGLAWWFDVEFDVRDPLGSSTGGGGESSFRDDRARGPHHALVPDPPSVPRPGDRRSKRASGDGDGDDGFGQPVVRGDRRFFFKGKKQTHLHERKSRLRDLEPEGPVLPAAALSTAGVHGGADQTMVRGRSRRSARRRRALLRRKKKKRRAEVMRS